MSPCRMLLVSGVAVLTLLVCSDSAESQLRTRKTEGELRYSLRATHGAMGPGAAIIDEPIPPSFFWTNFLTITSDAPDPGVPMTLTGTGTIWHNVAPHPPEPVPGPTYSCEAVAVGSTLPGVAITVDLGAGAANHGGHWDASGCSLVTIWTAPDAILRFTYAEAGGHDPPPGCANRVCGITERAVMPPTGSQAIGSAALMIFLDTNAFALAVTVSGIAPTDLTGAHIQVGGPDENGPAIIDLGDGSQWEDLEGEGLSRGIDDLFPAEYVQDLLAGRVYIQLDTLAFPDGELRGQLVSPVVYSNSGDLKDPFKVTRAGGHCGIDGDATDVQTSLGLGANGWNVSATNGFSLADDFEVPPGRTWLIDGIVLHLYQTDAVSPTITSIDYAFSETDLLGQPPPAFANAAVTPTFSSTFRKSDVQDPNTGCGRRLQRMFVPLPQAYEAGAGRHWLAWRASGSTSFTGPWQTPVVIPGQTQKPDANGLASQENGPYQLVVDSGPAAAQQDFVFELTGLIAQDGLGAGAGDLNCDGALNGRDVRPFVLALLDAATYQSEFSDCDLQNADCNSDTQIDTQDIPVFVQLLMGL